MRHFISFILPLVFLLGCGESTPEAKSEPSVKTITGLAQGTTYSVKYWHDASIAIDENALKQSIDAELARIDLLMSNYRDDSNIEIFNQNKVANIPILLDTEILAVLKISAEVHHKSQGCYDPTIGPLFNIWGFKKDDLSVPEPEQVAATLESIGFETKLAIDDKAVTKLHPETTIGLSAIGQGYAVAQISQLLTKKGITNYLTEIGGEMLVSGRKPNQVKWRIGVERPVPNSQKISETIIVNGDSPVAIMTSGTYRHYFDKDGKRYSHILDPRLGKPVEHNSVAVTVMMNDATYADAWSTALLCLGSEVGLKVADENAIDAVFYDEAADQKLLRQESLAAKQRVARGE